VQEGGPAERLKGVEDVVPVVEADARSTPIPADTSAATFAEFYRATFSDMTQLAFLLTGSAETARDLAQDAFVRLHDKWGAIAEPHAYLRRSVVNACHSHHRRLRLQRRLRDWPTSQAGMVDLGANELTDAIAALPYRQRAAIVLRFWHDSSEAEIAAALACRPGTAGSLIHRALAELRKVMP
jgi:RNA polymerase sigma factor (sigma-70 family)